MKKASWTRLYKRVRYPIELAHARVTRGKFAPKDVLIVTGDPRSGTTWLGSMLSAPPGISSVFEPLHLEKKHVRDLGLTWRYFIDPQESKPRVTAYFDALFSGQIVNVGGRIENSLWDLLKTERWLIKFVRAGRLLPWLIQNYTFSSKPVLIIRHPCGVIYSQMLHKSFETLDSIAEFDLTWIRNYRPDLMPLAKRIQSEAQIRALTWALDNWIPLQMVPPGKFTVVSYEQLVEEPEDVLRRVYANWGEETPMEVYRLIRKPSRSMYAWAEFDDSGRKRLGTWKQYLSETQVKEIVEVASAVGLTAYSSEIRPDYSRLLSGRVIA